MGYGLWVMGGCASPQGICACQIPHTGQPYLTVWNYECAPVWNTPVHGGYLNKYFSTNPRLTFRNRPGKKPKVGSWLRKRNGQGTGEGSYSETGIKEKNRWRFLTLKQEPRTEPSRENWYRLGTGFPLAPIIWTLHLYSRVVQNAQFLH